MDIKNIYRIFCKGCRKATYQDTKLTMCPNCKSTVLRHDKLMSDTGCKKCGSKRRR